MIRASMIFLVLLLLGAAAGRYSAEASVREARKNLRGIETEKQSVIRDIKTLQAEIAYLESPDRLENIASIATDLQPAASRQLLTSEDFILAFSSRPASVFSPLMAAGGQNGVDREKAPRRSARVRAASVAVADVTYESANTNLAR